MLPQGYRGKAFALATTALLAATSLGSRPFISSPVGMRASAGSITKEIIIVRHGTTVMNELLAKQPWGSENFVDANQFDTRLSERGLEDATRLNRKIRNKDPPLGDLGRIECLVSSPLTRALQTAQLAFKDALPTGVPRLVLPLCTERTYMSSEVGRTKEELTAEFPDWNFDLLVDRVFWYALPEGGEYREWRPKGTYACLGEPAEAFSRRMKDLRRWLEERPERVICVVCHWGVARALTGLSFSNCEARSFKMEDILREPFIDRA